MRSMDLEVCWFLTANASWELLRCFTDTRWHFWPAFWSVSIRCNFSPLHSKHARMNVCLSFLCLRSTYYLKENKMQLILWIASVLYHCIHPFYRQHVLITPEANDCSKWWTKKAISLWGNAEIKTPRLSVYFNLCMSFSLVFLFIFWAYCVICVGKDCPQLKGRKCDSDHTVTTSEPEI